MKSKYLDKILKIASKMEIKLAQVPTQSSQSGDIYKAIFDSKVLGLKGNSSDAEFDVNSKAADIIFGIFDKANFKGQAAINIVVDPKKNTVLKVDTRPASPKVSSAIQQAFQNAVSAAVKRVAAPASTIILPNVVVAQNG